MSRNKDAGSVFSGLSVYINAYYKACNKEVPADREYDITGTVGGGHMVIEPCVLLPDGEKDITVSTEPDSSKLFYWTARCAEGEVCSVWLNEKPLTDGQLTEYTLKEQVRNYMTGFISGRQSIVGYWNDKDSIELSGQERHKDMLYYLLP